MKHKKLPRYLEIIIYLILGAVLTFVNFFAGGLFLCKVVNVDVCAQLLFPVAFFVYPFIESILIAFVVGRKIPAILGSSPIFVWLVYSLYLIQDQRNYPGLEFDNTAGFMWLFAYNLITLGLCFIGVFPGIFLRKLLKRNR